MGRPRTRPDDAATVDRVLAAAAAEFARRGFEGARLEDIAASVGITRPSLLYHFPSKQALYEAVVRDVFGALGAALAEASAVAGAFTDRFDHVMKQLVLFFDRRPDVAALLLREVLDAQGPGHLLLVELGVPVLRRIERFVREEGRGVVRADLAVRAALLQITTSVLVRAASGPLREALWGKSDKTRALARTLILKE